MATATPDQVEMGATFFSGESNAIQTGTAPIYASRSIEISVGDSRGIYGPCFIKDYVRFSAIQGYTFNIYGYTNLQAVSTFYPEIEYKSDCFYFCFATIKDNLTSGYYNCTIENLNGTFVVNAALNGSPSELYDVYIIEISSSKLASISKEEAIIDGVG